MTDFNRPTLTFLWQQSRADINGRLAGADSFLRRSVLGVLALVWAGLAHGIYGFVSWLAKQLFVTTATGAWLNIHAEVWGLTRKAATAATGPVAMTGTGTVPTGTELRRSDGALFETTAELVLDDETASVAVVALVAGSGGNTLSGTAMSFVSPVAGVSSSVTSGALSTGADEEGDEALRARILGRIQNPPQGGSRADYERWTLEVVAVTRAWVYPSWSGPGTVGITFVCDGRDDIIPLTADLEDVEDHLDPLRPVTAEVIVFAPIGDDLDLEIHLTPDSPAIRTAVTAQLTDLLAREGQPGGTILLTHIAEAISLAAGELDHDLVSPVADVTHAAGHMPVLGTIDWGD